MNASFIKKHIDAHAHLQFADFDLDRDEVIARARDAGVVIVNASSDEKSSRDAVLVANKYTDGVFACVGLHPGNTYHSPYRDDEGEAFNYDFYKELAQNKAVVGIGECGLDYFRLSENFEVETIKEKQKNIFRAHIALANELGKPLVIHCREAYTDVAEIIKAGGTAKSPLMHFFAGTISDARALLDLGFYFTFGGVITFPPKKNSVSQYDEVVRYIPLDRILTETDAPDVAPVPFRGKRNESLYVLEVEKRIAEIRGVDSEIVREAILLNAKNLFGI